MSSSEILSAFDALAPKIELYRKSLEDLISRLIQSVELTPHSITSRIKGRSSLSTKLERKEGKYERIEDITDLLGIRVITYLNRDVDAIADIIESEFVIDRQNSADKRLFADPDRFGYKSLHYIVELNPERIKLQEYKQFAGIKAEIQIRTIIQHAWAEIEHDLGYKSPIAIPNDIRRRFFRLSALLETADDEFSIISTEIAEYQTKTRTQLESGERSQEIDATSMREFILSDPLFKSVSSEIARRSNKEVGTTDSSDNADQAARYLRGLGMTNLSEVGSELETRKSEIIDISVSRLGTLPSGSFANDLPLLYLAYSILSDRPTSDDLVTFLRNHNYSQPELGKQIFQQIKDYRNG
jgi:putative GTP pyrophosphokinase